MDKRVDTAKALAAQLTALVDQIATIIVGKRSQIEDCVACMLAGGHLLIAGAGGAFGPGGYIGTTLEGLSPLSGRVTRDLPRLALALVLDKSGSMNETVGGGVTKLDLIKSAALNSALLLSALMLLRHIGERSAADVIFGALTRVLAAGATLTRDLGGTASTTAFTDAVVRETHAHRQ